MKAYTYTHTHKHTHKHTCIYDHLKAKDHCVSSITTSNCGYQLEIADYFNWWYQLYLIDVTTGFIENNSLQLKWDENNNGFSIVNILIKIERGKDHF